MNAVIMAGGKGTRLRPLTDDIPKPMVKIIDKPVLEYTLELLKKHGVTDIAVTLGYLPEKIISYFGTGEDFGVNLTYFIEDIPLGTAGGVKQCRNFVTDDFLVLSGDAYTEIDLSKAIEFHKSKNSIFTVVATPHPKPLGLGVLEIDFENLITAFVEKPSIVKPSLVNTGIYVVNKRILHLTPDGFYDFGKNLLPSLTEHAYAYVDYSYWSDIGTLTSYYNANAYVAEKIEAR